jgi:hypothetical protein
MLGLALRQKEDSMNTKFSVGRLGMAAVGAVVLGLAAVHGLNAASPAGQHIEGSWYIMITPDPGSGLPPQFPVMHTFLPGGAVLETASLGVAHGAGHGQWVRVGDREFRYTFQFFAKDQTGNPSLLSRVKARVKLNGTLDEFVSCAYVGEIFDDKGVRVLLDKGTCKGKRIEVDVDEP